MRMREGWWGGERIWASQRFLLPLWISQLATNSCVLKLYIIYIRICVYLCMYIYLWIPKQQRQTLTACMSFAGGLPKFQLNLPQIQSGIQKFTCTYLLVCVCVCVYYSIAECIQHIAAVYVVVVMQRCKT